MKIYLKIGRFYIPVPESWPSYDAWVEEYRRRGSDMIGMHYVSIDKKLSYSINLTSNSIILNIT